MTEYRPGDFAIYWVDAEREPMGASNPEHPKGIDVSSYDSMDRVACVTTLPYPAKGCGYYVLECKRCGLKVVITTAGRPDDPRSAEIGCL